MDTSVRAKLIDLHVSHGQIERALREYLILADSYQQLAQMDKAREIYEEALRLVPRVPEERDWKVRILHKIGDTAMRRVDWKGAVSVYEQIRGLVPGDERAHLTLVDLFYRLEQPRRALEELDDLLRIYREEGRSEHLFTVLRDIVERWPDIIPLRARLAQAHLDAGHTEEALEHLEQLVNLQVDAGKIAHARATIQAIIALHPSDVGEYRTLLEAISEA
jgi:tetratricopeptide (TPR) repeat protein